MKETGSDFERINHEVKAENESELVQLLVGALTCIVLVVVVRIELHVLGNRKQATGIESCIAPLAILISIEWLYGDIRLGVIHDDR